MGEYCDDLLFEMRRYRRRARLCWSATSTGSRGNSPACSEISRRSLDASASRRAVIFLGDLCDRGPNTSAVLSFVAGLSSTYPDMEVKLLAGNHDLAMSLFWDSWITIAVARFGRMVQQQASRTSTLGG